MVTLEIGVLVRLTEQPENAIAKVVDLGLRSCQVSTWDVATRTNQVGERLTAAAAKHGVNITTLWAGYSGPVVWNFTEGPVTIGLVPPEHRQTRIAELKQAGEFAAKFKLPSITTHAGFLPENPSDPLYDGAVDALKQVAGHCAERGIGFWFETGQETPVTLLRTIDRVATGNLGINLDTANLILYGKGNPVDAIDVFGQYVRDTHVKDGLFPTDGLELGPEVPLGEGKANLPVIVEKLKACGYDGALTIEREISGPQQIADIHNAIELLRPLC